MLTSSIKTHSWNLQISPDKDVLLFKTSVMYFKPTSLDHIANLGK